MATIDEVHDLLPSRIRVALSDALSWWETVQAMNKANGGKGVSFVNGYEPTWVKAAREALGSARIGTQR